MKVKNRGRRIPLYEAILSSEERRALATEEIMPKDQKEFKVWVSSRHDLHCPIKYSPEAQHKNEHDLGDEESESIMLGKPPPEFNEGGKPPWTSYKRSTLV